MTARSARPITGRHVLTLFVVFFGVIFAVNMTMAFIATQSWTGLLTKNVYVESQRYDDVLAADRALAATGLSVAIAATDGRLTLTFDAGGATTPSALAVLAERPVGEAEDTTLDMVRLDAATWQAREPLRKGAWKLSLALVLDGTSHLMRRRIEIADGSVVR